MSQDEKEFPLSNVSVWLRLRTAYVAKMVPLLLFLALQAVVQAQDYTCSTNNNNTITITKYTGPGGAVTISDTINGLPVTSIGNRAFWGLFNLMSVTIPNSVTNIGDQAFAACYSLFGVFFNGNAPWVGSSVFEGDFYATVYYLAGTTGWGQRGETFAGCPTALLGPVEVQYAYTTNNNSINITGYFGPGGSVTIPSTINGLPVTSIGDIAFCYFTRLTSVTIPNSVTRIGNSAFANSSLISVTIGNSVTSIGNSAFADSSLISVTIGNSVTSIGDWAFSGCYSLEAITVDATNSVYRSMDGALFNKSQTTLIQCPGGKAGSYTIPNNVTSIGDGAFSDCHKLTNITIPDSVTSIGWKAFHYCGSLTSLTIPNSITSIGDSAFYDCYSLTSVTIGDSVTSIGTNAFYACTSLTNVMIPNSVTNIGYMAFSFCTRLTSVTIPKTVTTIGLWAFSGCSSVTNITIPSNVTSIGDWAFSGCNSLETITVDATNSVYSSVAGVLFNKSQTTLIQCPGGKAGGYTIPDSVTLIGDWAFSSCTRLISITIPARVTSIGLGAFNGCSSLTGLYCQGNAPSVDLYAFDGDNNATVYFLAETTGWGSTFAGRPTALWNSQAHPQVQTGDASFGVRTNRFGFTIAGTSDLVIVVEACSDLANPAWSPLQTNTLSGDSFYYSFYFSDPQWTNYPARFYRLRSP